MAKHKVSKRFKREAAREIKRLHGRTTEQGCNPQRLKQFERQIEEHGMAIGRIIIEIDRETSGVYSPDGRRIRSQISGSLKDLGKALTMLDTLAKKVQRNKRRQGS